MKRAVAAIAVTSLIALSGACGSGNDKPVTAAAVKKTTTTTIRLTVPTTVATTPTTVAPTPVTVRPQATTATTAKPTATTAAPVASVNLESKLIKNLPAGYIVQSDDIGDTGPSDLGKAVVDDGEYDALSVLTNDGFVKGYQRLWLKDDMHGVVVIVYQFASAAGASHYEERVRGFNAESDEEYVSTPFAVAGIPNAAGFMVEDVEGETAMVGFARGNFVAQVIVFGEDATPAAVTALAMQQYNNLA